MGVDWYTCASCHETFNDCGNFFGCDCGEMYCSPKCGDREGDGDGNTTCEVCRGEVVTDEQLIEYLVKISGKTLSQHKRDIMESRKKK